jgi:hypothetical protein
MSNIVKCQALQYSSLTTTRKARSKAIFMPKRIALPFGIYEIIYNFVCADSVKKWCTAFEGLIP